VRPGEPGISRLAASPDGVLIACGMNDGRAVLVDASSEKAIQMLAIEQPPRNSICRTKRKKWIRKVKDGKDPFTRETLKELRDEVTSFDYSHIVSPDAWFFRAGL
jgi:hypothetical protein